MDGRRQRETEGDVSGRKRTEGDERERRETKGNGNGRKRTEGDEG